MRFEKMAFLPSLQPKLSKHMTPHLESKTYSRCLTSSNLILLGFFWVSVLPLRIYSFGWTVKRSWLQERIKFDLKESKSLSHVWLFCDPMESSPPGSSVSRQEFWSAIKKSINNKCWKGCGEKGTLLHCWWECKLVQPLWRTEWRFFKKLEI